MIIKKAIALLLLVLMSFLQLAELAHAHDIAEAGETHAWNSKDSISKHSVPCKICEHLYHQNHLSGLPGQIQEVLPAFFPCYEILAQAQQGYFHRHGISAALRGPPAI